ncbi:restriction endonuclease subunit S [Flavobacterium channae]|uniref:restriction endonuclease subunit S n=1 Tax=Flavobacterium channae TaxID=2897181 RepID=UPI001E404FD9|nr:restriction endonuclease subunit S [Flavobacterium channae]UGS22704.1 restriction endonuclease subunit S [Flavobacterium channae]
MKWEKEKLGEICEILDNKRKPISKNKRIAGEFPYYGATGIVDYVNDFIFDERLVLVGEDGAKWCSGDNTAFIVEGKVWVNNHAHVLKPKNNLIDSYLVYYLNHRDLSDYITGLTVPKLNQEKLRSIPIPLPSLEEQRTIVAKLDQAFAAIDQAKANIEKNIANAKELFQSKLNQIFSKNTLSTETENNEGWQIKTLGELGKVSMCKRILKNQTLPKGDIPFYKIGTFGKEPDAYISKEIFEEYSTKYSYPKKGQILLSASGTIGRTVIFDGKPSFFQDSNIVWIDNNEDKVLNDFLYHFYKVCDWNPSKGATISRLYNDDLRRIKISFPNIEEQKRLIPQIEKLQEQTNLLVTKYQQKLANLEELKKSILEKAFKGELSTKEIEKV